MKATIAAEADTRLALGALNADIVADLGLARRSVARAALPRKLVASRLPINAAGAVFSTKGLI